MTRKEIAEKYIDYLEKGDIQNIINLFNKKGIVDSPLYGIKKAKEFYYELKNDTTNSKLDLMGIFEESDSNKMALYFSFKWTLKNNKKTTFDVVDILEFDTDNKISRLKIIYDTVIARRLVEELKN